MRNLDGIESLTEISVLNTYLYMNEGHYVEATTVLNTKVKVFMNDNFLYEIEFEDGSRAVAAYNNNTMYNIVEELKEKGKWDGILLDVNTHKALRRFTGRK